jgi:hypothetical protein
MRRAVNSFSGLVWFAIHSAEQNKGTVILGSFGTTRNDLHIMNGYNVNECQTIAAKENRRKEERAKLIAQSSTENANACLLHFGIDQIGIQNKGFQMSENSN